MRLSGILRLSFPCSSPSRPNPRRGSLPEEGIFTLTQVREASAFTCQRAELDVQFGRLCRLGYVLQQTFVNYLFGQFLRGH
jgi:hypothetical protein